MKNLVFLPVFAFFTLSLAAQNSDDAFPFNVKLTSPDGKEAYSKKVLKQGGKPTVLAFWLTTCQPCKVELATYAKAYPEWQKEQPFNLFAISIDYAEKFPKVQEWAKQNNYPFPIFWDGARAFKDLMPGNLNGLPQVFVFDAKGGLRYQHKGFRPGDENELFRQVQQAAK
ncbi:MAG: TlpA family protein disulfide reductase [Saprospiraceae bacterium]|nr:TlpA family protein disulfide reductase [Saprospiraceae bacterium]